VRTATLAVIATASLAVITHAQTAASTATLFEAARVIIGDGRPALENTSILVVDGVIRQVGRSAEMKVPAGATRLSVAGRTIMPAIVDTHVHTSQAREALEGDLRRRAYWGIGAVMSLGQDTGEAPFQIRAERTAALPRFFTAGRGLTMPEPGRSTAPYWITTAAEGRKAVQELAAKKVDIVKIWVDDRNGQFKKLTPDLYGAIIDEAHRHKLRVTAHLFTLDDAKGLLRAGIDAFAHGVRDRDVDNEFLAQVKERSGFVLVPNLPDRGVRTDLTWLRASLSSQELQALEKGNTDRPDAQAAFAIQARNLARMNAAGVRIALGSDGNTPWAPHAEMADMVAAGMTPAQVIVAATRNGARFLGMTDTGTIESGMRADFIMLQGNPLDDITNTRRIEAVYLNGRAVERAER
jgi:imidazolonepropionase-like amidohydrolase